MAKLLFILLLVPQVLLADNLLDVLDGESKTTGVMPSEKKTFRGLIVNPTAEQNILISFLEKGEYQKAIYQWTSAFEKSSFPRTSNGKALYGFLLFNAGLEVLGVETLFGADPKKIDQRMISLWRNLLMGKDKTWAYTNIQWAPGWTTIFSVPAEVMVKARRFDREMTIQQAEILLRKTTEDTWERAWSEWQLVVALLLNGQDIKAAKLLKHLQAAKNNPISQNLMNLTAARMLYQNGYLTESIRYYQKISKSSDYWFEAQEELAWSHLRLGKPQNSLAILQSLLPEEFEADIGPEVFYLGSLSHLKICDYQMVSKNLQTFRSRFQRKAKILLDLKANAENKGTQKLIGLLEQGRTNTVALGQYGSQLPRYATRDEYLYYLVQRQKRLREESERAGILYSRSLSEGTALVGFQAKMERFKKQVAKRSRVSYSAVLDRLKTLADEELDEVRSVLKKMQIVEAELIQQLAMSERVIKDSAIKAKVSQGSTGSQARDTIRFPFEGELWFDEISNYRVDVAKGCQAINKKGL